MSIKINREKCRNCRKCVEVCHGNLIKEQNGAACLKYPKNCWGCASCVKVCPFGAVDFYLGADIGGRGSTMNVTRRGDILCWNIHKYNGEQVTVEVNSKNSNTY